MLFSPVCFCPYLEEFPPPSLKNIFFQGYSFLKEHISVVHISVDTEALIE